MDKESEKYSHQIYDFVKYVWNFNYRKSKISYDVCEDVSGRVFSVYVETFKTGELERSWTVPAGLSFATPVVNFGLHVQPAP